MFANLNPLAIKQYVIVGLIALVIGSVATGLITFSLTKTYFNAQTIAAQAELETTRALYASHLADLRITTAEKILTANNAKSAAEIALLEKKNELNQDHQKRVASLQRTLADLAGLRLQDPARQASTSGSGGGIGNSNSSGTGGSNGPGSGEGLLSEQASQFLLAHSAEADVIVERLRTCQVWVNNLETQIAEYNKKVEAQNKKSGD